MVLDSLCQIIGSRLNESRRLWWRTATEGEIDRARFLAAFSGAGRRLGAMPVGLTADEEKGLSDTPFHPEGWPMKEAGRVVLLLTAMDRLPEDEHAALVEEVYRTGDLGERITVLRSLQYLPDPGRFAGTAGEGVRANADALVEAIACDNPYPAEHLETETWNQMVMKAVFLNLPLARVIGLEKRRNPELARMARDFAAERRAAGRPVPEDLALIDGGSPQ